MNIYHIIFLTTNFLVTYTSVGTKPLLSEQKSFSENGFQCMEDDREAADKNKAALQSSDYYQPNNPKMEVSDSTKLENRPPFDFKQKRSESPQKRQVGVIYRDEQPIGILQPYQRSYRFIPVKEENAYALETNPMNPMNPVQEVFSGQGVTVDKRNTKNIDEEAARFMKETYPQILANFKLDSKLEKKRSEQPKQPINEASIRDLKATIRKLRSTSDSHQAERIEEELKNILDDMGLIEEDEAKGNSEKREAAAASLENDDDDEDPLIELQPAAKNRNRREFCKSPVGIQNKSKEQPASPNLSVEGFPNTLLGLEEKKSENSKISKRHSENINKRDREQREQKSTRSNNQEDSELLENLKDSGDLMVSGNKSPLASSSEVRVRESGAGDKEDQDCDETRVERQIQDKIQSLKEEVKREIEALRDEEAKRKKRQTINNLAEEETDDVNPVVHPDADLKPLIRKRRNLNRDEDDASNSDWDEHKRMTDAKRQVPEEESIGGDLLGDDYEDKRETKTDRRRSILDDDEDDFEEDRSKRGQGQGQGQGSLHANFYDSSNDLYEDESGDRLARRSFEEQQEAEDEDEQQPVEYKPLTKRLQRSRRRITEEQSMDGRPQQLSDMSDIDLFGALPKSYNGQLSRYKRVKRIKM